MKDDTKTFLAVSLVVTFVIVGIASLFLVYPVYNVWQQRLKGQAELARAESARRVLVAQAEAEKEAATLRSQAIQIVGKAAKEFPEYRQQEFIGAFAHALESGKISQIIYVPTERNIPIVEVPHHNLKKGESR